MVKPRVFVTRHLPEIAIELLSRNCEVRAHDSIEPLSREALLESIDKVDGLLCVLMDRIDRELLDRAERLKVVSTMSVGFEHISVEECTVRGIYVSNTPGVLTEATADHAFALLLAAGRRVAEGDRLVREGVWKIAWYPTMMLGGDIHGKCLGIVGLGRIGEAVARRAKGFSMKLIYYKRTRLSQEREEELGVEYRDIDRLLGEADYVSVHLPLTRDTHHFIDEHRLRLMKSNSILVNTSRGATVDQKALARALEEGWIRGAGIDVFEVEPLPKDDPLATLDSVVLTPHLGSATLETRQKMAELAARGILSVLRGEKPEAWVNPRVERVRPLSRVKML